MKRYFHINKNSNFYSVIMYIIMGGFTTLVNFVVFWLFAAKLGIDYRIANTIAWVVAVLFAYVTNRTYVFKSHSKTKRQIAGELGSFVGFRFLSYLMDLGVMIVLISGFGVNESWSKIWTNVLVMIANYLFSKLFVFRKKSTVEREEGYR
ncbi:GtrA family protein [Alicyclobacillus sp. SO9]|uniref:GtrA family protein n=1 Tax=Alicyclobacillus sp. SO9 TaxID=2665646 RepID=UPI0018E7A1E5|nr:GtrA family protein [Alicyclobacillus sp. SO9]QQE79061.1 GtrA family protein [Alicyclobacillus sp. SO9]